MEVQFSNLKIIKAFKVGRKCLEIMNGIIQTFLVLTKKGVESHFLAPLIKIWN